MSFIRATARDQAIDTNETFIVLRDYTDREGDTICGGDEVRVLRLKDSVEPIFERIDDGWQVRLTWDLVRYKDDIETKEEINLIDKIIKYARR